MPALALWLAGCGTLAPPALQAERGPAPLVAPPAWQAALPHGGERLALAQWWAQFDDPLLVLLIARAQDASASVAAAGARIAQARSALVGVQAGMGPVVDANASAGRSRTDPTMPAATTLALGAQARWELDLFGGAAAARDAARERLQGAGAGWHEARVAVAAELAGQYVALRACEAQRMQTEHDARSRAETARLTEASARAGFQPPAQAALARAGAAQAASQLQQQRLQCDSLVKALVGLSDMAEPELRARLAPASGRLPRPAQFQVAQVPAEVLAQRPDVEAAGREVLAAGAEITQTRAQRLPRISLAGSIGAARMQMAGTDAEGATWSIGPVSVTLPLFDGGAQAERVLAAQARLVEARARYAERLRVAVREVEDALLALQSAAERQADVQAAAEDFALALRATQARQEGGLASLFELEDARRSALQAQSVLIELQRARVAAWIALYRALGGGWSAADAAAVAGAAP